jgi:uncharacterized membrane protein
MSRRTHRGAVISSGILLGAGLGGFFDGIVFHQILQWHNMLSSVRPPTDLVSMKYNMVWDGVFHAATWLLTVFGLFKLWRAGKRPDVPWSTPTFVGALLLGWGTFNVVEGVIDHFVLGIHHVHPGEAELAWDLGFVLWGLFMIGAGWHSVRRGRGDDAPRGA